MILAAFETALCFSADALRLCIGVMERQVCFLLLEHGAGPLHGRNFHVGSDRPGRGGPSLEMLAG